MDVTRMAEVLAHESFNAMQDMLLREVKPGGDATLKLKGKRIERTAAQSSASRCARVNRKS